nr:MAG: nonstructural protein [Microviridae sp.]
MSLKKIFSVRDNKVSSYGIPFFNDSEIGAARDLQMAVNDDKIQLSYFPEDFELFELGSFDNITAEFIMHDKPKFIIGAISLKKLADTLNK